MSLFDEALKKSEELADRLERKRAGSGFGGFDKCKYMFLHFGGKTVPRQEKVFRIYGNPMEMRKLPTDPKLVFFSPIVKDGGKAKMRVIWKTLINDLGTPEVDEDWILMRLYKKVNAGDWHDFTEEEKKTRKDNKAGTYIPKHSDTKSFIRISKNAKEKEEYPLGFYPKPKVLMNVIDRMDDWCVQNKHSKILTSTGNPWNTTRDGKPVVVEYVNSLGIPHMAYKMILDNVVKFHHGWDIDVVCKATGELSHSYEVRDITEQKIDPLSRKVGKDIPLTKEELEYGLYDLDAEFHETTYRELYTGLLGLFKMVDAEFNEKFVEELTDLYNKEATALLEKKKNDPNYTEDDAKVDEIFNEEPGSEENEETADTPQPEERKERAGREASVPPEVELAKVFPFWSKLDKEDVKDFLNAFVKMEGLLPLWKPNTSLAQCEDEKCVFPGTSTPTFLPSTVLNCPCCGMKYKTPQKQ
jgi:hypothetical protein